MFRARLTALAALTWAAAMLGACAGRPLAMAYDIHGEQTAFRMFDFREEAPVARPFALDLAVVPEDIRGGIEAESIPAIGAGLFSVHEKEALFAKNVYERLHPASLTKVMAAIVALKYGAVDDFLTCGPNVETIEAGAQKCGLKRNDQLTLSQALHLSLINSANDAAIAVAEGVAGSLDEFVTLMNRETRLLGATNTNFANPHGLTHEDQYTTVYDMYLIMNAAIKYEVFNEIIKLDSYTTSYMNSAGGASREITVNSTNLYLQGSIRPPYHVDILGGKTGTTNAAGHCLAIIGKDPLGRVYIAIVMRAESRDDVYGQMNTLLAAVPLA